MARGAKPPSHRGLQPITLRGQGRWWRGGGSAGGKARAQARAAGSLSLTRPSDCGVARPAPRSPAPPGPPPRPRRGRAGVSPSTDADSSLRLADWVELKRRCATLTRSRNAPRNPPASEGSRGSAGRRCGCRVLTAVPLYNRAGSLTFRAATRLSLRKPQPNGAKETADGQDATRQPVRMGRVCRVLGGVPAAARNDELIQNNRGARRDRRNERASRQAPTSPEPPASFPTPGVIFERLIGWAPVATGTAAIGTARCTRRMRPRAPP